MQFGRVASKVWLGAIESQCSMQKTMKGKCDGQQGRINQNEVRI
jgi:hypothetical protein